MPPSSLADLARRLGGEYQSGTGVSPVLGTGIPDGEHRRDAGATVGRIVTDSREARSGGVFLAIRGERSDGHDFLPMPGVVGVVERPVAGPHILVPELVPALARMARSYRDEFHGPVIGVTGSAGKTTTKEFAAAALATIGPVAKTEANRNTEFTAPLIWPEIDASIRSVVVEMGMRGRGQIAHLASFARPTIGVVTNVGWAHVELLGDREGIAAAKGELFEALPEDGIPIAWAEDEYLWALIAAAGDRELRTFGYGGNADLQITSHRAIGWNETHLEGVCDGKAWRATVPVAGRHVALSAAAGLLAAVSAGADLETAAEALKNVQLPPMRMEIRHLLGATFVVDTYNASPPAMVASLEALTEMPSEGRRIAVLGHMRELGEEAVEAHREVGRALGRAAIDVAILYGPLMDEVRRGAIAAGMDAARVELVDSLEDVRRKVSAVRAGDTVLVKASRAMELERALEGLA